jgi:Flp pilus assembly protein TadG
VAHRERGAAMVELALLLPLLVILIMGMISAGTVYNRKLDIVHAAREGARYGATVPQNQCTQSGNPCGGLTWAELVRSVVVQRSDGDVTSSQVCVALVTGATGTVVTPTNQFTTNSNGSRCFDDGNGDSGRRVQVRVTRTGEAIDAAFFRIPVTLQSSATAKFEGYANP